MSKKKLPLPRALFIIISSTLIVTGSVYSFGKKYFPLEFFRKEIPLEYIATLVQTGPEKEALSSTYLEQLMGLCIDQPIETSLFNVAEAEGRLKQSPLIKEAKVQVMKPGTVFVDYTVRKPLALLYDFENTAVDEEGMTFPLFPFLPPRHIPEIYLGIEELSLPIGGEKFTLAKEVLKTIQEEESLGDLQLERVDVANAFFQSYGKKELVVIFNSVRIHPNAKKIFTYFLRMSPDKFPKQLKNFASLHKAHFFSRESASTEEGEERPIPPLTIDLRIDDLAFIHPMLDN